MEKGTFSDKNIADYITANFVAVKIKSTANEKFNTPFGEKTTSQLVRSLQIRGVPATYFFDARGQLIFNVPGYVPDDTYKLILQYIAEKHYESKSFEEFQNSANE
jgi:thioredoxin-related protein